MRKRNCGIAFQEEQTSIEGGGKEENEKQRTEEEEGEEGKEGKTKQLRKRRKKKLIDSCGIERQHRRRVFKCCVTLFVW